MAVRPLLVRLGYQLGKLDAGFRRAPRCSPCVTVGLVLQSQASTGLGHAGRVANALLVRQGQLVVFDGPVPLPLARAGGATQVVALGARSENRMKTPTSEAGRHSTGCLRPGPPRPKLAAIICGATPTHAGFLFPQGIVQSDGTRGRSTIAGLKAAAWFAEEGSM